MSGTGIYPSPKAFRRRDLGVRATVDIDIYRHTDLADAERELREAAAADLGDWSRFELGAAQPVSDGAPATGLPVDALIGPTVWPSFPRRPGRGRVDGEPGRLGHGPGRLWPWPRRPGS